MNSLNRPTCNTASCFYKVFSICLGVCERFAFVLLNAVFGGPLNIKSVTPSVYLAPIAFNCETLKQVNKKCWPTAHWSSYLVCLQKHLLSLKQFVEWFLFSQTDDFIVFSPLRAFFWLVSLLLSSLVWFISVQISNKESASQQKGLLIFGVVLSVVLQETFRFGYYKLLK